MGGGQSFPIVRLPRERIVIVTGSNAGLGYEIAKWTAMMGATVIMACRSEERARAAIARMNEDFKVEKASGTRGIADYDELAIEFMKLDLNSFQSVVEFAEAYKRSGRPLHVLFCNAGIALRPFAKTEDGFECCLQVNYLSHFILTAKLLPVMKRSGEDCRIFNMSSKIHPSANFDLQTINYDGRPEDYPIIDYYARSKLYQIMQMFSMIEHNSTGENITINCIHPGVVGTTIANAAPGCLGCLVKCAVCFASKAEDGAKCSIDCTVNPKYAGVGGMYFSDFKTERPSATSRDKSKQEALWQKTFEIVGKYLTEEEIAGMKGT